VRNFALAVDIVTQITS